MFLQQYSHILKKLYYHSARNPSINTGRKATDKNEQTPKSLLCLVRQFRSKFMHFQEYPHDGGSRLSNSKCCLLYFFSTTFYTFYLITWKKIQSHRKKYIHIRLVIPMQYLRVKCNPTAAHPHLYMLCFLSSMCLLRQLSREKNLLCTN